MTPPDLEKKLAKLLGTTFDAAELRIFLRQYVSPGLTDDLPEPGEVAKSLYIALAAEKLVGRGLVTHGFVQALAEKRPGRAAEIAALAGLAPTGDAIARPAPQTRRASGVGSQTRRDRLHVLLDRYGDAVYVSYQLPGGDPFGASSQPWAELGSRIERAAKVLEKGKAKAVSQLIAKAPAKLGRDLFAILFGDPKRHAPVLRRVFGFDDAHTDTPSPTWAPVRVCISTADPLLASLPWRLTGWDGHCLVDHGWRFVITSVAEPTGDHTMKVPANVLIVAPGIAQESAGKQLITPTPGHSRAIREVLARVWPDKRQQSYIRTVTTREDLQNAIRGMKPQILYIHAATVLKRKQTYLLLNHNGEPDPFPLEKISKLFDEAGHKPRVVYLNTAGTVLQNPLPDRDIPLVIWRRTLHFTTRSSTFALEWLREWLDNGRDPVDALHEVSRAATEKRDAGEEQSDAATVVLRANYGVWQTPRFTAKHRPPTALEGLDRDEQKALIVKHLHELAQSPNRRVLAVVAYAEPGNHIADLWSQLRRQIDIQSEDSVIVSWKRMRFPDLRHQLDIDLRAALAQQLDAAQGEVPAHLLRRHAPKSTGSVKRVLWLEWGTCGPGETMQKPLNLSDLTAWLRFSSEYLAKHCPGDIRVVSYIAIETGKSDVVSKHLAELRRESWCRQSAFRLDDFNPDRFEEKHLLVYFTDHSDCPTDLHNELTDRIMEATGGHFAQAVALLESSARVGSWYDLLQRLRKEQGTPIEASKEDVKLD